MMHDNFKRINTILNTVLIKHKLESSIEIEKITLKWDEIVGLKLSKLCKPKSIKNGVLTIEAIDTIWRNELANNQEQLLNLIENNLEKSIVKKIIFS